MKQLFLRANRFCFRPGSFVSASFYLRRFAFSLALLVVLLGNGCSSTRRESQEQADKRIAAERAKSAQAFKKSIVGGSRQISIQELDQLAYGYADRYFMVISSAVDAIKRGNMDPAQRRMAHQIKLDGVLSMNDIVSGNDPVLADFRSGGGGHVGKRRVD
ncbi:MAG: hypothetical protein QM813_28020 [Verrucomicrobiota bacterium]